MVSYSLTVLQLFFEGCIFSLYYIYNIYNLLYINKLYV